MKKLIKGAIIVDPRSPHHGAKRDVLIGRNKVEKIAARITDESAKEIRFPNSYLSPGWFDTAASFRDPGFEWKEDITTGLNAAEAGGFTAVLAMPNTLPPVANKASVQYALGQGKGHRVELAVAGCISAECKGEQLAEMADMQATGALAFTDYKQPINRTELMSRALEYARNFDALVMSFPWDNGLGNGGVIHEGEVSISLGLKGLPSASEEMRLSRDLDLLRYTGGRMHVMLVSTARAVALIKAAKKEGLAITCGVAAHQLQLTHQDNLGFDSMTKVLPPLRSLDDVKALRKAVVDGTIDVVCSDHSPEDIESKEREFEHAAWGFASLETTFSSLVKGLGNKATAEIVANSLSLQPREIFGKPAPVIAEGEALNLTHFALEPVHTFDASRMKSKSKMSPFDGQEMPGEVHGVYRG